MTVSVFVGTSVDGFITRPNGDLEFLPGGGGPTATTSSSQLSMRIVIGRKTFETVLAGRLALCFGSDWALGVTFPPSERRGISCCGT
jgi:dihydrofolate reductase